MALKIMEDGRTRNRILFIETRRPTAKRNESRSSRSIPRSLVPCSSLSYSMEINVTAALTKCDALSLSLSVRSHGAQRSLARSLAAEGGE